MWRHKRIILLSFSVVAFVVVLLALPVLLGSGMLEPICTLPKAHAQDNPCLAQEATISAMQVSLVQSTLDALSYQATITALESALEAAGTTGVAAAPPTPVPGLPFVESFDDNSRGWDLTSHDYGVARISQGQLLITANRGVYWHPIPGLQVDEFYIEATVTANDFAVPGFGVGNKASGQYHMFVAEGRSVSFYDQTNRLFETVYDRLYYVRETFTAGLESTGGLYTLFINGSSTETAQITPYGNQVGILVFTESGSASAAFDDIVVRPSR